MKKIYYLTGFILILLVLSMLYIFGCGGDSGTVINPGITPYPTTPIPQPSAVIGSNGGTVEVTNPVSSLYGVKVEIPQGALSSNTNISISEGDSNIDLPSNDYQKVGKVINLQPSGTSFTEHVDITIPFDKSINLDNIVIITYEPSNGIWDVPTIINKDTVNNSIKVSSFHFSYVIPYQVKADFSKTVDTKFVLNANPNTEAPSQDRACIYNNEPGLKPNGSCYGFAVYSKWHFLNKSNILHFFDAFDRATTIEVVNETMDIQSGWRKWIDTFADVINLSLMIPHSKDYDTAISLYTALLTNQPQVVGFYNSPASGTTGQHAVLVYKWDSSTSDFIIYDSNAVGPRKLHFDREKKILYAPDYQGQVVDGVKRNNFDIFIYLSTENSTHYNNALQAIFNNHPVTPTPTPTITPTPPPTDDYFPLDTGWKWNYKQIYQDPNGTSAIHTYEMTNSNGTFQNNPVVIQKLHFDSGKVIEDYYQKNTDIMWLGWKDTSSEGKVYMYKYNPFCTYLNCPLSLTSWSDNFNQIELSTGEIDSCTSNKTILAQENVNVYAGTFTNCYKVKWDQRYTWSNNTQENVTEYWWYAPNVGIVKWTKFRSIGSKYWTTELIGYTNPSGQKIGDTEGKVYEKSIKENYEPAGSSNIMIKNR